MNQYRYLIIGGGITADSAVQGIRAFDTTGSIAILAGEPDFPYDRPPLTKALWFGKTEKSIMRPTHQHHVNFYLETTAVSLDPIEHTVIDHKGVIYKYDKLLLATGGTPRHLECPSDGVIYYRTLADYHHLRETYTHGNDFVVIGGGFIGPEIAAALVMNGKNVTMIFPEASLCEKKFPKKFSRFLSAYFTEQGVKLCPGGQIKSVSKIHHKWKVMTHKEESFFADAVIAGIGITPNDQLAKKAGAICDNGIVVDEFLKTSLPNIWAAGDVANFYSPHLEKRVRIEHEDAANSMGRIAGGNMAGAQEAYAYLPYFYSDLFNLSYQAIGELAPDMQIVEDWVDPNLCGTIYFLSEDRLRGALVMEQKDQIPKIRDMILSKEPFVLPLAF